MSRYFPAAMVIQYGRNQRSAADSKAANALGNQGAGDGHDYLGTTWIQPRSRSGGRMAIAAFCGRSDDTRLKLPWGSFFTSLVQVGRIAFRLLAMAVGPKALKLQERNPGLNACCVFRARR